MLIKRALTAFVGLLLLSCEQAGYLPEQSDSLHGNDTIPEWAANAVWYQIFPERFYNGDPNNDPTVDDIKGAYPGFVPESWRTTPWTQAWYRPDDYFQETYTELDFYGNPVNSFSQKTAWRRYGGDLAGVLEKLDYLDDLGITAIYFNPLNDAPSLHKYDAANWRHIDRNFGPNPRADVETMRSEDPNNPDTWQWTEADRQFLEVIDALHERDIRVVMDFSWNHTGINFWAWQSVLEQQRNSPYRDWYWVTEWDDPSTESNEFKYHGWFGVHSLPEIRESEYVDHSNGMTAYDGNIYSDAVKQHIFNVSARWLDPNGDGDPSDGVDGFRLDVAAELPLSFWREYRAFVRSINPEAYLIGEIWWEQWPDKLMDPTPYLQGDIFDAHMNYRWYRVARHIFADAPDELSLSDAVARLNATHQGIDDTTYAAFMNMSASHDSPRLATSLFNRGPYKVGTGPTADNQYRIDRPDATTWRNVDLLLLHQFSYLGSPQIWAGDEMGMWGADDPHTRKPLIWPEFEFEDEMYHPFGLERKTDVVHFDHERYAYYRTLIAQRNSREELRTGRVQHELIDDETRTWIYRRTLPERSETSFAIFNLGDHGRVLPLDEGCVNVEATVTVGDAELTNDRASVIIAPRSATLLVADCEYDE